jgi:hypothetical protein
MPTAMILRCLRLKKRPDRAGTGWRRGKSGVNRSAQAARIARFGRSLSLPPLEHRSTLSAILVVVLVLFLDLHESTTTFPSELELDLVLVLGSFLPYCSSTPNEND